MISKEKITNELYQSLGKLFYAIAIADKVVRPIEVAELNKNVHTFWLSVDGAEDEYGTDAAYQIAIVFDWLQQEEKESQHYFEEFAAFYKEHSQQFNLKIKQLTWKTACDIALSFRSANTLELNLLTKLRLLLEM
ncbi:hypothetical protein [uncultured Kriegella sp.]|uniref:hypothetical protein n=1 Tax=uncultured Kriegella sp. TaxID=1798910 RepID=UPI0030DD4C4A|tara:strand:+ start:66126 stop:66530 length:405 start_codon:yes stop_codon:yes gene_type:complete